MTTEGSVTPLIWRSPDLALTYEQIYESGRAWPITTTNVITFRSKPSISAIVMPIYAPIQLSMPKFEVMYLVLLSH